MKNVSYWFERFPFLGSVGRYIPAIDSLRYYSVSSFSRDLVAGLTVAAVALPQAMAYAYIAGIPPQNGLFTAMVMTTVGALLDSSKQLINGPTNAISIAVLSAISVFDEKDKLQAAILLALIVGIIQTGIALLRLGDLTRFISHAVIVGFTLGASMLLVLDQLKNLIGLPARGEGDQHFLVRFWLTMQHWRALHGWTAAVGLGTIALVLGLRWMSRRGGLRVPEFLITVIVAAFLVKYLDLEHAGVNVVGHVPADLPSFKLPMFEWARVRLLTGSGLAIALLGLLEALAMAKAIAAQTRQKLDMNQQCLSEGLANLTGSFFQCFPGSGSLTRSAINQQAGAVSQWSGVISALAIAGTVLLFAPLARYVPRAALAGILMVSSWRLVDWPDLFFHLRATRFDAVIVVATALSAVFISVEFCILIGVLLSFLLYIPRADHFRMTELTVTPEGMVREWVPCDPPCGKILAFNLDGDLFFGAASRVEQHLIDLAKRVEKNHRVVVLRVKYVRNADAVGLRVIDLFIQRMEEQNVTVLICGVRPGLARALRKSGLQIRFGMHRIFKERIGPWSSTLEAVHQAHDLLENDYCANCPRLADGRSSNDPWHYTI